MRGRTLPNVSVTFRSAVPNHEMVNVLPRRNISPLAGVFGSLIRLAGLVLAIGVLLGPTGASAALHSPELDRGARVFRICVGCHSLKAGEFRLGPPLAGLIGRKAGAVPGYRYSKALRQVGIIWNATTLDAWLADPQEFVPGSRMPFSGLKNDRTRAALIAFLESATRAKP